jgi:hypothetical protein
MKAAAGLALALILGVAGPVVGHHVGTFTPRDNEISANFKQLKFSIEAGRFDVAQRLFETGAVRKEMRAQAARLPTGLEETVGASLRTRNREDAERGLMVFFAALTRDLALEANRQVFAPGAFADARAAAGQKFLEAIWRYYNLIDFAVSRYDPKAAVAIRLAFDEAASDAKSAAAPVALNPCAGPRPTAAAGPAAGPRPERLLGPLRRIAETLAGVVETASPARRPS